jgi:hypothetical protein
VTPYLRQQTRGVGRIEHPAFFDFGLQPRVDDACLHDRDTVDVVDLENLVESGDAEYEAPL